MFKYIFYIKDKFLRFSKNYIKTNSNYKIDNIIISHLVNYENLTFKNDFYFGNLASKLNQKHTLIVLIDHIKFKRDKINKKLNGNYIILCQNLGFLKEIQIHLFCFFKLLFRINKNFNLYSYLNSIDSERISKQMQEILLYYKPKNLILTFEGHDYEKLIINYSKKSNLNMQTVGYQFGVLKKKQLKNLLKTSKEFIPKKIFTTNEHNKNLLKQSIGKKSQIVNVGYLKKDKKMQFSFRKKIPKKNKNILVMPEGIPNEINTFINFCSKQKHKDLNFNIRLHPIFRNNQYLKKFNIRLNKNIKFSQNSLRKDFNNNDFILYRGTAAVIEAINYKIIPIYLSKSNEISVDPLFKFNKFHKVSEKIRFNDFLTKLNSKLFLTERKRMSLFAKNYYKKPNIYLIKRNLN